MYTFNIPQRSRLWIWLARLKYDCCDIEWLGLYWIFNLCVDRGLYDVPFLLIAVVGSGVRIVLYLHCIELAQLNVTSQGLVYKVNTEPSLWYHYWEIQEVVEAITGTFLFIYFFLSVYWIQQSSLALCVSSWVELVAEAVSWEMKPACVLSIPVIPSCWTHTTPPRPLPQFAFLSLSCSRECTLATCHENYSTALNLPVNHPSAWTV